MNNCYIRDKNIDQLYNNKEIILNNRPLNILILCHEDPCNASTITDHISAFKMYSRHKIYLFDPVLLSNCFLLDLNRFDVIVIHYTIAIMWERFLSSHFKEKLTRFKGLKVQFIQDDYRRVNECKAIMRNLDINIIFTPYLPEKIPLIYDEVCLPGAVKLNTLTGYIPHYFLYQQIRPIEVRPVDVGYRGRVIPYWLGKLSQEKVWIGQGFLKYSKQYDLSCDISSYEKDRIYGEKWLDFLGSCKAVLGTESGASITDFDGSAERRTLEYLEAHPDADFEEVYEKILMDYEGNLIENAISPRVFEAAALKTALVLFPGYYNGIVKPWVHYIPLEKDFSNFAEVVDKIKNNEFLKEITERTYVDLIKSEKYSYRMFIKEFDGIVDQYASYNGKCLSVWYNVFLAKCEKAVRGKYENRIIEIIKNSKITPKLVAAEVIIRMFINIKNIRKIFYKHIVQYQQWRKKYLLTLIKNLLLLGTIKSLQSGKSITEESFQIDAFKISDDDYRFASIQSDETRKSSNRSSKHEKSDLINCVLECYLNDELEFSVIWDHTAVGTSVTYRSRIFKNLCGFKYIFGNNGIHRFFKG